MNTSPTSFQAMSHLEVAQHHLKQAQVIMSLVRLNHEQLCLLLDHIRAANAAVQYLETMLRGCPPPKVG